MKTKSILNKISTLLYCTLLAMIIVTSCKKDYQSQDQPGKQELSKLEQWYQSSLKVSDDNPFSKLKPNWTDVYVRQQGPHNVYEVSLGNQEQLVVSINEEKRNLEELAQNTGIRLLIFEERASNKILYASYMNVQANSGKAFDNLHYKNVGNFTGTILYYHFSGNLSNGWNYLNGKITEKITAITEQQFSQAQKQSQSDKKTQAMVCTSGFADKYQWQCVGVPGYLNCGFNYVGKEYITVCNWQEPEQTIDHIAPEDNGGGYMPPIYIDCAGVAGGKATWSTQCNTCIGGTTGIETCADIKKDSLKKYYPCMDKLILQKLENDTLYSKLIQPFQSVYAPGIGTINFKGLPQLNYTFSSQPWGASSIYKLGETSYSNIGSNSTIYFNSSALANASQLMLQVAAIHETGHSYVHYYIKNGQYNVSPPVGEGLTWSMGIINFGALLDGEMQMGNYVDHSILLDNYFEKMIQILKSINGTTYTDSEYRMAALYGMDNAGSRPSDPLLSNYNGVDLFSIYQNQLQKTYNDILTKYGITAAQLNTFYNSHIINTPPSKKLPSTCP